MEFPAHVELRNLVVASVIDQPTVLKSMLRKENMVELLRSDADLGADLLLHALKRENSTEYIFACDSCRYTHVGPENCRNVGFNSGPRAGWVCPKCRVQMEISIRQAWKPVDPYKAVSCNSCYGIHTTNISGGRLT